MSDVRSEAALDFRSYIAGYLESAASLICIVQADCEGAAIVAFEDVRTDLDNAKALLDRAAHRICPMYQMGPSSKELN